MSGQVQAAQAPSLSKALSLTFEDSGYCFKLNNLISHTISLVECLSEKGLSAYGKLFKNAMTVALIPKVFIDKNSVEEKGREWSVVGEGWTNRLEPFLNLIYAVSELFQSVFSLEKVVFLRESSLSGMLKKMSVMNDYIQLFKDSVKLLEEKNTEMLHKHVAKVVAGSIVIGLDIISISRVSISAPVKHGLSIAALVLKIGAQIYAKTIAKEKLDV